MSPFIYVYILLPISYTSHLIPYLAPSLIIVCFPSLHMYCTLNATYLLLIGLPTLCRVRASHTHSCVVRTANVCMPYGTTPVRHSTINEMTRFKLYCGSLSTVALRSMLISGPARHETLLRRPFRNFGMHVSGEAVSTPDFHPAGVRCEYRTARRLDCWTYLENYRNICEFPIFAIYVVYLVHVVSSTRRAL